jgi:energy-coupling factor transport system permease protein
MRIGQGGKTRRLALVEESPLRRIDPRAKLALALGASLVVMLPPERLLIFIGLYILLLGWARLLPEAARQAWRLKWIVLVLFVVDWWLVDLNLAVIISLRLLLLSGVFALLFSTTTTSELGLALERLGFPYRYAFTLSLAFQSIGLLDQEWRAIQEAQKARGFGLRPSGFRQLTRILSSLISLTVPAVVLTTKRAWSVTEAASARGFDSPKRVPYRQLDFRLADWIVCVGTVLIVGGLFWGGFS